MQAMCRNGAENIRDNDSLNDQRDDRNVRASQHAYDNEVTKTTEARQPHHRYKTIGKDEIRREHDEQRDEQLLGDGQIPQHQEVVEDREERYLQ